MGSGYRSTTRGVAVAVGALMTTVALWLISTLTLAAALAATALMVPGTGTPNANIVGKYLENARDYYVAPFNPACTAVNDCDLIGINYPAQFWPIPLPGWGGLSGAKWDVSTGKGIANLNGTLFNVLSDPDPDTPVVMFGYSQGGNVVSRQKRLLRDLSPELKDDLSFVMIGNTNRPNGGLFERLAALGHVPILDATFGLPAPTDVGISTTDIAFEYDGVADFPLYPLNLLATMNAIAGFAYVHGTYLAPNAHSDVGELPDDYTPAALAEQLDETKHPENFRRYGDSTYITIPTRTLPMLRPLLELAAATRTTALVKPVVDLISPVLRVLIDTGYNRALNPGVPAPLRLIPLINPFRLLADLIRAAGQGIRAALTDIFGGPGHSGPSDTAGQVRMPARSDPPADPPAIPDNVIPLSAKRGPGPRNASAAVPDGVAATTPPESGTAADTGPPAHTDAPEPPSPGADDMTQAPIGAADGLPDNGTRIDTGIDTGTGIGTDPATTTESEPGPDTRTDAATEADSGTRTEAEPEAEPGAGTQTQAHADTELDGADAEASGTPAGAGVEGSDAGGSRSDSPTGPRAGHPASAPGGVGSATTAATHDTGSDHRAEAA